MHGETERRALRRLEQSHKWSPEVFTAKQATRHLDLIGFFFFLERNWISCLDLARCFRQAKSSGSRSRPMYVFLTHLYQ